MSKVYGYGVDLSDHNSIDFNIKPYDFIAIRCAWGTNEDKNYKKYIQQCEENNIPYMFYLYSYALDNEGAKSEAEYALDIAEKYNPFCIFYDMEDADGYKKSHNALSKENCTSFCKIFCDIVSKAKYYTGVYCNPDFLENYVDTTYPIWLAHWGVNPGTTSGAGKYQKQVVMHQYQGDPLDKDALLIPLADMKKGGAAHKETDIPEGFTPEKASFTLTVNAINVRSKPTTDSEIVAQYKKGQTVYYDSYKANKNEYVWISYIGGSGKRRYLACGEANDLGINIKPYGIFK